MDNLAPPELLPNDPEGFGKALRILAERIHPEDADKAQTPYLIQQTGIPKDAIYKALNGQLNHPKQAFTSFHFRLLIETVYGHGKITIEEAQNLARAAGSIYWNELGQPWFIELTTGQKVLPPLPDKTDHRYPHIQSSVLRSNFLNEIAQKRATCLTNRFPLVITGLSGSGKTTLVEQIIRDKNISHSFPDGILTAFMGGSSHRPILRIWSQEIGIPNPLDFYYDNQLKEKLTKILLGQRKLILLDDVANASEANALLDIMDLSHSWCIITSNDVRLPQKLTIGTAFHLEMPGFSSQETEALFTRIWGASPTKDDKDLLEQLNRQFNGNPLSLHFAFHDAIELGLPETIERYAQPSSILLDERLDEVYLPMVKSYERLSTGQQEHFRAIGVLPILQSYQSSIFEGLWDLDQRDTKLRLSALWDRGFVQGVSSNDPLNSSKMHKQVHLFAQQLLEQHPEEEKRLIHWEDRVRDTHGYQHYVKEFGDPENPDKLSTVISYAWTRKKGIRKQKNTDPETFGPATILKQNSPLLTGYEYLLIKDLDDDKTDILIWQIATGVIWGIAIAFSAYIGIRLLRPEFVSQYKSAFYIFLLLVLPIFVSAILGVIITLWKGGITKTRLHARIANRIDHDDALSKPGEKGENPSSE